MPREHVWDEHVGEVFLALDDDELRLGERRDDRLRIISDLGRALRTGQHEDGHGNLRCVLSVEWMREQGADLSRDRVCNRNTGRPRRLGAQGGDLLLRNLHDLAHEELERRLALAGRHEGVQAFLRFRREVDELGTNGRPALVEDECSDVSRQRHRAPGAVPAIGVAVDGDGFPGGLCDRVDYRSDVLELAPELVVGGVAARSASASVHGVHGHVRL